MSIRRNTAMNVAGAVLPMLVLLVTVPHYLRLLGQERYGVLSLVWLLLGYLSFMDFALGRATARQIAQTSDEEITARAEIFWTALGANLLVGLAGSGLIWFGGAYMMRDGVQVAHAFREEVLAALPWISLALPVALTTSVLQGTLEGRSHFGTVATAQVAGNIVFQLVPLVIADRWGATLQLVIPAAVLSKAVFNVALFAACRALVVRGGPVRFVPARARMLLFYGGWFAVSGVTGTVIDTMDRMVIAAVLGPRAVAQYAVPYQLSARVTVVPTAVATALFPRFSRRDDPDLSARAFEALRALMTPLIIAGLFLVGPFLRVWIGSELATVAAPLACIFLVGVWAAGLAQVPLTTIMGSRNPRVLAVNYLAQLPPYLGLMVLLTSLFGLPGAATAWLVRAFADCVALCWLAGITRRAMTSSALPLSLVVLASLLALELAQPAALLAAAASLVALSVFIGRHQLAMLAGPVLAKIRSS